MRTIGYRHSTYSSTLLLIFLLSGCGSGDEDLKQWVQSSSQGLHGQIPPLPPTQSYPRFIYHADNLLDPFSPQKLTLVNNVLSPNAPDFKRPREALENYDLDKLKMVGNIYIGRINYALVRTPEGTVFRVQTGQYIGPNFGRVTNISDTEITLAESVENLNGEWVPRTSSLSLAEQGQTP